MTSLMDLLASRIERFLSDGVAKKDQAVKRVFEELIFFHLLPGLYAHGHVG